MSINPKLLFFCYLYEIHKVTSNQILTSVLHLEKKLAKHFVTERNSSIYSWIIKSPQLIFYSKQSECNRIFRNLLPQ